jgi:hypothetical protein
MADHMKYSIRTLFALTTLVAVTTAIGVYCGRSLGIASLIVLLPCVNCIAIAATAATDRKCLMGNGIGIVAAGPFLWVFLYALELAHAFPGTPHDYFVRCVGAIVIFGTFGGVLGGMVHLAMRGHKNRWWPMWLAAVWMLTLPFAT